MPYRDEKQRREAAKQRMRRLRAVLPDVLPAEDVLPSKAVTPDVKALVSDVLPVLPVLPDVTPVIPDLDPQWRPVVQFLKAGNLEKLQRIAGSLGKYAGEVRFGLDGPTFKEIGEVIGRAPARYPR